MGKKCSKLIWVFMFLMIFQLTGMAPAYLQQRAYAGTAPTVSSAATSTDGLSIILTMSSALTGTQGSPTDFIITGEASFTQISDVTVSGTTVTLVLSSAIVSTDTPEVSYTPSGTNDLTNGTPVAAFLDQAVSLSVYIVARGITAASITAPVPGATSLILPTVPSGFTIAITSSSNTGVIAQNGTITPPAMATTVNLVFTVTKQSDNSTADTDSIAVTVPAATGNNTGSGNSSDRYPPIVQTEAVSTVTAESAVLNGDITSDNGYDVTDYGFLWGTSSNSLINKLDEGSDNHSGAFTHTLSSLTAGTTYYFQAYATNSYGTTDGAVLSFTTTGTSQPTKPTTIVFSDVPASYWAYVDISNLSNKGIVSGYPDGTFEPGAQITRAEFCAMIVNFLNAQK